MITPVQLRSNAARFQKVSDNWATQEQTTKDPHAKDRARVAADAWALAAGNLEEAARLVEHATKVAK